MSDVDPSAVKDWMTVSDLRDVYNVYHRSPVIEEIRVRVS